MGVHPVSILTISIVTVIFRTLNFPTPVILASFTKDFHISEGAEQMASQWNSVPGLTPQIREDLRKIEQGLEVTIEGVERQEGTEMSWQDEANDVEYSEPVQPKRDCQIELQGALPETWIVKESVTGYQGHQTKCVRVTCRIIDPNVTTEHEEARPRLVFDQTFNIERHPYFNKKVGEVRFLSRGLLHSLEEALGFDPIFHDADGNPVEPRITRNGTKTAPNRPGIKQLLNPAFVSAYFTPEGVPNLEWSGKQVYCDLGIEESEDGQFPPRNRILRFKRAPAAV